MIIQVFDEDISSLAIAKTVKIMLLPKVVEVFIFLAASPLVLARFASEFWVLGRSCARLDKTAMLRRLISPQHRQGIDRSGLMYTLHVCKGMCEKLITH